MPLKIDMENIVNGRDDATNFSAQLLRLISKADGRHKAMLKREFPNTVEMVEHYQETGEILDLEYD